MGAANWTKTVHESLTFGFILYRAWSWFVYDSPSNKFYHNNSLVFTTRVA